MRFSAPLNTRTLLLPPHPSHLLDPSLIVMWLQALRDHRAAPLLCQPPAVTLPTHMARTIYGPPLRLHAGLAMPHPQLLYRASPLGDMPVSPHNARILMDIRRTKLHISLAMGGIVGLMSANRPILMGGIPPRGTGGGTSSDCKFLGRCHITSSSRVVLLPSP